MRGLPQEENQEVCGEEMNPLVIAKYKAFKALPKSIAAGYKIVIEDGKVQLKRR